MATVTFDTLKFVEKLRAAGVSEAQAKAEAEALVSVLAEAIEQQLATKEDIRGVKADIATLEKTLKADIATLEKTLKADMATLDKTLKADMATRDGEVKAGFKEVKADIILLKRDTYVIKWMMGMVLASVISLVLKAFFQF